LIREIKLVVPQSVFLSQGDVGNIPHSQLANHNSYLGAVVKKLR